LALYGGEWLASRLSRFTLRKRASSTHWLAGWVGGSEIWYGRDDEEKIHFIVPAGNTTPVVQPVAYSVY